MGMWHNRVDEKKQRVMSSFYNSEIERLESRLNTLRAHLASVQHSQDESIKSLAKIYEELIWESELKLTSLAHDVA